MHRHYTRNLQRFQAQVAARQPEPVVDAAVSQPSGYSEQVANFEILFLEEEHQAVETTDSAEIVDDDAMLDVENVMDSMKQNILCKTCKDVFDDKEDFEVHYCEPLEMADRYV